MDRLIKQNIKHGAGVFNKKGFIALPLNNLFNSLPGLTVEAWVYPLDNNNSGVVSKWQSSDITSSFNLSKGLDVNNGKFHFNVKAENNGITCLVLAPNAAPLNKWTHYAGTFDGRTSRLYENGVLVATVTAASDIIIAANPTRKVLIGKLAEERSDYMFNGSIDDVRIWNYARTDEQIKNNYNKTLSPQPGLITYLKLDGNSADSSGNNIHGVITDTVNWVTDGAVDAEYVSLLDGVDDCISLPDFNLNYTKGYSIEAWMKPEAFNSWSRLIEFSNGPSSNNIILGNVTNTSAFGYHVYPQAATAAGRLEISNFFTLNKWVHVTLTHDINGLVNVYRNGINMGSMTMNLPANIARSHNFIAKSAWSQDGFFKGRIGFVRIWNKAITPQEIYDNLFKLVPPNTPDLIEQFSFDNNLNGSKGAVGTLVGGATFIQDYIVHTNNVSSSLEKHRILKSGKPEITGIEFNGVNRWVYTPLSTLATTIGTGDFTITYWANCKKSSGNNIAVAHGAVTPDFWFGENGGKPRLTIGSPFITANTNIANTGWRHLVCTRISGIVYFYVDGKLDSSFTFTNSIPHSSGSTLRMGSFGFSGSYYNGDIGSVRVMTRGVQSAEVSALMHTNTAYNGPSMYAEFLFLEKTGIATYTVSGVKSDLNNGTPFIIRSANTEKLMTSKDKQPFMINFNGSNQSAALPTINLGQAFTISCWVRYIAAGPFSTVVDLSTATSTDRIIIYSGNSTTNLIFNIFNGSTQQDTPNTGAIEFGKWMHVTMTYDNATKQYKCFKNGIQINSRSNITYNDVPRTLNFLGMQHNNSSYLNGNITDFGIFNKALTDLEIRQVMVKGINSLANNLIVGYQGNYSNNLLLDCISNKNATLNNNPKVLQSTAPLINKSSLVFSGANPEVLIPADNRYKLQTFTLEFWVYPISDGRRLCIVTTWNGFTTEINPDGTFKFGLNGLGSQYFGSATLPWNMWTHVACTYNSTTGLQAIYFNGKLSQSQTVFGTIVYQANPLYISGGWSRHNGKVACVRIWDKVLSEVEIRTNMHHEVPSTAAGLIEQWPLNESVGNNIFGTKGFNGTISGTASWSESSNINFMPKCWDNSQNIGSSVIAIPEKIEAPSNGSASITYEFWANKLFDGGQFVIGKYIASSNKDFSIYLSQAAGAPIIIQTYYNGTFVPGGTSTIPINTWAHWAFTYNKSNSTASFYCNGILLSSTVIPTFNNGHDNLPLLIGGTYDNTTGTLSSGFKFRGLLDDVRVWNYARSQSEIQQSMKTKFTREYGLVLNIGFETNYWDASGYNNHGSGHGTSSIIDSTNKELLVNAPIN
jgi:hypothetical protein